MATPACTPASARRRPCPATGTSLRAYSNAVVLPSRIAGFTRPRCALALLTDTATASAMAPLADSMAQWRESTEKLTVGPERSHAQLASVADAVCSCETLLSESGTAAGAKGGPGSVGLLGPAAATRSDATRIASPVEDCSCKKSKQMGDAKPGVHITGMCSVARRTAPEHA